MDARDIDAYCATCGDVTPHRIQDVGSCACTQCDATQVLVHATEVPA